jgi:NADPH:quinone reductase-like Zn-dependent oxidoreductase
MFAIRHHEFGQPVDVLRLEQIAIPQPAAGAVRVRLLAAVLNPSDYGMIAGSYGRLRELPAIAGREGVGVVDALGEGVSGWQVGQRVRFPGDQGAWCEYACAEADSLLAVPDGVPVEQAALSFVNPPTAFCLLTEIIDLQPGDWLVQNAANSAVGVAVIQLAKALGVHTINTVRRDELIEPLRAMGADHVVLEGSDWTRTAEAMTDGGAIKLALNSIGGESAIDQIKVLGKGGTQVTFGGMVGDKVRFPTRFLIFNDVRLVGFWWDQWSRNNGLDAVRSVLQQVYRHMCEGTLKIPIAGHYPFSEFNKAFAHDKSPRLGKILLHADGSEDFN